MPVLSFRLVAGVVPLIFGPRSRNAQMSWNKAQDWLLFADLGSMVKIRSSNDVFLYRFGLLFIVEALLLARCQRP
jgi:hypothetical protein